MRIFSLIGDHERISFDHRGSARCVTKERENLECDVNNYCRKERRKKHSKIGFFYDKILVDKGKCALLCLFKQVFEAA